MTALKLTGAALTASGAVLYGLWGLFVLKQRLDTIRKLTASLLYIVSRMEFSQLSIIEIFREISARSDGKVGEMFTELAKGLENRGDIAALWTEALQKTLYNAEECEVFMPLGLCLGMTDINVQLKTAQMAVNDAREYEKRLRERIERYKAVDMRLRMMCGATAVILLI